MRFEFLNVCNDVTKTATKIPQSEYLSKGLYPIYDQGKDVVGGYSNCNDGIANDYPYICFGDHTRVIKYIDSPCFIGADGVKLLKVMNNNFLPKYVYYSMVANPVDSQGYSRHYKLLKETTINYVDRVIQSKIIDELDNLNNIIRTKKDELLLHDELIKSRFIEMFDGKYETKPLNEVCEELFAGGDVKKDKSSNVRSDKYPYPIYTNGEKDNGLYGYTSLMRVSKEAVTISGRGTIGFTCLRKEPFYPAVRLIVAVPNQNLINGCYLQHFIQSKNYGGQGASIPQLTVPMIKKELIPLPPISVQNEFKQFVEQIDKSKFVCYSKYFLWLNFTFVSSTIAYSNVVSILEWPNRCWTCSIGIPLSIAFVANVLLNLCGCTLSNPIFCMPKRYPS